MMAAEAGASRHTLAAYRSDLERAAEALGGAWLGATPTTVAARRELGRLAPSTVARRSAALRRFYGFLLDEGLRARRSVGGAAAPALERPLPRILDETRSRGCSAAEDRAASGEAARAAQPRADRIALRLGPARDRIGRAAARRGAPDQPFLILRGKGEQGAAGADLRPRRGRGRELARACAARRAVAVPRRQEASEPGAAVPARPRRWPPTPASRPSGSARTSFATPSPPICCRAAPTCARCRRCSAMPTSRRPRSTPMSTAPAGRAGQRRHPLATARSLTRSRSRPTRAPQC